MTDPGDEKISRRYRELAREEPPAHADAAILAAARGRTPVSREASRAGSGVRPRFSTWMGPLSIAAVLVLGIGVSLRMQLEKPGIETSEPSPSSAEYPMPQSAEPAPPEQARAPEEPARARLEPPERKERARAPRPIEKAKPLAKRIEPAAKPEAQPQRRDAEPNPFADAPVAMQQAPVPAAPATTLAATAPAAPPAAAPPAPAPPPLQAARPPVAAESARASAPAVGGAVAPQPAPMRAKREGFATDSGGPRESRAIAALADPDPNRELERIARLREAGRHPEADRALDEFRRRHPDFRISEPVWKRVKPR